MRLTATLPVPPFPISVPAPLTTPRARCRFPGEHAPCEPRRTGGRQRPVGHALLSGWAMKRFLIMAPLLMGSFGGGLPQLVACQADTARSPDSAAPRSIVDPAMHPIDAKIESELQSTGTPGAALVVVRDGRIVHARGYGLADVESRRAAD